MPQVKTLEALTFLLYAVLSGGILGVLYDVFRVLRSSLKAFGAVLFLDVLYFLLASVFIFLFCLTFDYGRIRGFFVFGFLAGFLVYRKTLSRFVYASMHFLSLLLIKIIKFLISPILKCIKVVTNFIKDKIFLKIYKNVVKKVLKKPRRLLYNKKYNSGKVGKISVSKEKESLAEIERYFS